MLLSNWALLDRLFRAAAAFIEEGSLETRTYGKRLLFEIRATVAVRSDWERLLAALRPEALRRRVVEVLEAPGGPPPPPVVRGRMGECLFWGAGWACVCVCVCCLWSMKDECCIRGSAL